MENLFTADEARKLTISQKKTLEDVIENIKTMAGSGVNYATLKRKGVFEHVPDKIKELGYNVELTPEFICITW